MNYKDLKNKLKRKDEIIKKQNSIIEKCEYMIQQLEELLQQNEKHLRICEKEHERKDVIISYLEMRLLEYQIK